MGKNPDTGVLEPLDFNHLVSCLPEFSMLRTGIELISLRSYRFKRICRLDSGRSW